MVMVACGQTLIARIKKTMRAINSRMPPTSSSRKRSKSGILNLLPFLPLPFPFVAGSKDFGFGGPDGESDGRVSSSSVRVSTPPSAGGLPARSPTGVSPAMAAPAAAPAAAAANSPSSSTVSSAGSSNVGAEGISGLLFRVLATWIPATPARGRSPASVVISARFLSLLSAARLSSFMLTILWNTAARLGSTKATTLPELFCTLSMMPVISSSISM